MRPVDVLCPWVCGDVLGLISLTMQSESMMPPPFVLRVWPSAVSTSEFSPPAVNEALAIHRYWSEYVVVGDP